MNSSSSNASDPNYDSSAIGSMFLLSSTLVIISNGVVVSVVFRSQSLHLPTMWNIAFMAVRDFCYGLFFIVVAVPSAFSGEFAFSKGVIVPSACIHSFLVGQGISNVLIATIDRFLALSWPLHYHRLVTSTRFIIVNSTTATINVIRVCLVASYDEAFYNQILTVTMFKFKSKIYPVSAAVGIVPLIAIVGVLIRMYFEIKRSKQRVQPSNSDKVHQSFTLAMFLSALVFCVGYIPAMINIIWGQLSGIGAVPYLLQQISILCLASNSLWNVLIYGAIYKPFRNEFLRLFCKKIYRRREQVKINSIS